MDSAAYRRTILLCLFVTILIVAAVFLTRGFVAGRFVQDIVAIFDGAYRVNHGQWPHKDFSLPFGALTILQGWVAWRLGQLASAFSIFQLTTWLLLVPPVLILAARQRRQRLATILVCIFAILSVVPIALDNDAIVEFNFNALYNRTSSAALFLVLIWWFTPKPLVSGRALWGEAGLVAYLLLLAFGWKISTFLVAVGVLGVAACLSAPLRRVVLRALGLFALGMLGLELASGGMVSGYVRDVAEMLRINRGGLVTSFLVIAMRGLPTILLAAGCIALLAWRDSGRRAVPLSRLLRHPLRAARAHHRAVKVLVTVAAVIAAEGQGTDNLGFFGLFVLIFGPLALESGERRLLPLVALSLLLAACYPLSESIMRRSLTLALRCSAACHADPVLSRVLGTPLVTDRLDQEARTYAALWSGPAGDARTIQEAIYRFGGGQNLTEPAEGIAWARCVDEAARTVREKGLIGAGARVMTAGWVEPFSRLLGTVPVHGGKLWHAPGRTMVKPTAEAMRRYLAEADFVFVQHQPALPIGAPMIDDWFMSEIAREFVPVLDLRCYGLWAREKR